MPSGRRKSTQPTTHQRTLAFGPHPNKVTKPTQVAAPLTSLKKSSQVVLQTTLPSPSPPPPLVSAPEEVKSAEASIIAIREPKSKPKPIAKSEAEERAAGLSEGEVRRYWRAKEAERKAPRVHQQNITMHEKILRHFDLSSQYGPCIGITRLTRWKRASKLGLAPPIEVLTVLVKEEEEEREREKGGAAAERHGLGRAYMDELLDAKLGD